jgi:hypothetical protein
MGIGGWRFCLGVLMILAQLSRAAVEKIDSTTSRMKRLSHADIEIYSSHHLFTSPLKCSVNQCFFIPVRLVALLHNSASSRTVSRSSKVTSKLLGTKFVNLQSLSDSCRSCRL